ncbi:MAG TPA: glycosyltransferase family 4 protein [Blastocatellia bacterium]|nr:glycosyltransferase family 4 protein [Blastocatellia bacterium]
MRVDAKPRLLILTSSFPCGPDDETCGYVRQFARHLATEFNVTVLAPPDGHAQLIRSEPYALVRSSPLLPERLNPFRSVADLNCLREASVLTKLAAGVAMIGFFVRAARLAWHADVICSHWLLPSGLIGALLSKLLGKPHVAIEHSGALHLLMGLRGGRWLTRFIVACSHRVVVVSRDLRRKLIALCPEAGDKCDVMPMGVDSDVAQAVSLRTGFAQANSLRHILFIGRLTRIKGVDVLIEALRDESGVRLIIAGDGPERDALERLAAERSSNVEFLGHVNAARRDALLAASDVVVIPSRVLGDRSEGTPVVCLEAMAAGRAVIASRTGGLAEIIRDTHNGLLFEPEDAAMLAGKLRRLLNDAALRARLGQNATPTAAEFAWPRVAAAYTRLIKESLDQNAIHTDTRANAERTAC